MCAAGFGGFLLEIAELIELPHVLATKMHLVVGHCLWKLAFLPDVKT